MQIEREATAAGLGDRVYPPAAAVLIFDAGFQTQIWLPADLTGEPLIHCTGHTLDLTPVLTEADASAAAWFFEALGWSEANAAWDDRDGEVASDLLIATLSHHGLPLQLKGVRAPNPVLWRAFKDLEPAHAGRGIGDKMRHCFLAAWNTSAPPLPDAPAFQHLFLELCTLADWLGSNELWFPFNDDPDADYIAIARERAQRAVTAASLDIEAQWRAAAAAGALPTFTELFGISGATPNAIQSQAAVATALDEPLVVIENRKPAPTDRGCALALRPHV